MYYFFLAVVVIRYETTATARWTLLFIVRAFFNDTITVAVWTGFHVRLMGMLPRPHLYSLVLRRAGGRYGVCQSLWTIRTCEQFCTDSFFEFEETEWFETPKPSAQVFRCNFKNIC